MKNIHTFAICAYKESPYLEECIKSLKQQSIKSNIILCTSTPNEYIKNLVNQYDIAYYINDKAEGIGADWNFAYEKADTKFVTIAHQDDIYYSNYTKNIYNSIKSSKDPIILYSEYKELRNGEEVYNNNLLKIKRIMNSPLSIELNQSLKIVRKGILAFGNPICCPAVTLNKNIVGEKPFDINMRNSLDWEAWIRLADYKGKYVYIRNPLMGHRISELSETTNTIKSGIREREDYEMFCKFWPVSVAKFLMKFYSKSMNSNEL